MSTTDDRLEIGELLSRCGHAIDAGQLDRLHEVFIPEVVYDLGHAAGRTVVVVSGGPDRRHDVT